MTKRSAAVIAVIWTLLAGAARAADAPKADLFAGYSLLQLDEDSVHGWAAGLGVRLSGRLGVVADLAGHTGSPSGVDVDYLAFMGGLRFELARGDSFAIAAYGLAGGLRSSVGIRVFDVTISESSTDLAWAAGGQADFRVAERLAIRVRGDYFNVRAGGVNDGNPRFAAGLVYRLTH